MSDRPAAWMLVRIPTSRDKRRVMHDRSFATQERAEAAALRRSNQWNTYVAVPVYEEQPK
jgi:hypothetical protein